MLYAYQPTTELLSQAVRKSSGIDGSEQETTTPVSWTRTPLVVGVGHEHDVRCRVLHMRDDLLRDHLRLPLPRDEMLSRSLQPERFQEPLRFQPKATKLVE